MSNPASKWLAASPLRHRLFLGVWIGSVSLGFGNQMQLVAGSWAMTEMTHSPQMVSLVAFALNLPLLLFSMAFGAICDLNDKRKVMGIAYSIMFCTTVGLASLALFGWLSPWLLLLLSFIFGTGYALNMPAWQASVRELVPAKEISAAVSMNAVGNNVTRTAGPGLGGIVVALGGVQSAFGLNALACIPMLLSLRRWRREPAAVKPPEETLASAIGGGIRFTFYSGAMGRVVLRALLCSMGYIAMISLLPLGVKLWLDGGSEVYGLLLSCTGIGSFAGVLAAKPLSRRIGPEGTLQLTQFAMAIGLIGTPLSSSIWLTGGLLLVFGAGAALMMLTFNVNMQLSSPGWVVGRALSVFQMGAFGGLALGAPLWGVLADQAGLAQAFIVAGGGLLACTLVFGLLAPLKRPDPEGLEVVEFPLQSPSFDPEVHHLPVHISCEYEIAPEDEPRFAELMQEWRRLRLSHGVRNWRLGKDPQRPGVWIEQFDRPSASDLLRQLPRMTRREKEIIDAFKAMHLGEDDPRPQYQLHNDRKSD